MNERTTRVDGLQIRYLEEGDGPAVVLLLGALEGRHRMSLGRAFAYYRERSAARPAGPTPGGEPLWQRMGAQPDRFLLLYGREDKPTTARRCERARELFPTLRVVLWDECR